MSNSLRITLFVVSFLLFSFVLRRIRKSGLEISESLFWMALSILLLVVSLIPEAVYFASAFFGFDSPSNFVFMCGIGVLLLRSFSQDLRICQLKKKLASLVQYEALKK